MVRWEDYGVLIAAHDFSENKKILTLLTQEHGFARGVFTVPKSKKKSFLMVGNSVSCAWQARLEAHLGLWKLELLKDRTHLIMSNALSLNLLTYCCGLLSITLPERHPYPRLYALLHDLLDQGFDAPVLTLFFFENTFLTEMGFGLDTESCAVTGEREGLYWVSPKTGRSVIKRVGDPYQEKLFKLPDFLKDGAYPRALADFLQKDVSPLDAMDALKMTGSFIEMHFSDIPKMKHLFELRKKIVLRLKNDTHSLGKN